MKRLLVGLSDEPYSTSATQYAVDFAQRFDASITAIGIIDLVRLRNVGPIHIGGGAAAQALRQDRYEQASAILSDCIESFVETCNAASVAFQVKRELGAAIPALIDTARYYDLLVCGLRGMFEHGVVAEPPNELARIVESGVPPMLAVTPQHREIKRVLIAYSGSVESASVMRQFTEMNLFPHARVKIAHFDPHAGHGAEFLADAQAYMTAHGLEVTTELVRSHPKQELLNFAENWPADLIVVGNSAKSLLRRRAFGETALETMRSSPLPLFLGQ